MSEHDHYRAFLTHMKALPNPSEDEYVSMLNDEADALEEMARRERRRPRRDELLAAAASSIASAYADGPAPMLREDNWIENLRRMVAGVRPARVWAELLAIEHIGR